MAAPQWRRVWRWYTLSVDTLRGVSVGVLALALLGVGFLAYRWWESHALRREAADLIAEAGELSEQLEHQPELAAFADEYASGLSMLHEALTTYGAGRFDRAVPLARRSRGVLAAILAHLERRSDIGEGHFISVHGNVQFRRGDAATWEEARGRVTLRPGDFVRTAGNGSAEIMFGDGTLYTVRPNSSIIVSGPRNGDGQQQAIKMDYGWVNLSTASRPTRVETPQADAHVAEESEAFVSIDPDGGRGRFGAVRGSLEVSTRGGERRRVAASEQVVQAGGRLSAPQRLMPAPDLVAPAESQEIDPRQAQVVVLEWQPVTAADGYELQVARDRLFVDRVIEDRGRARTRATLGIRGEGSFHWRVAAEGRDGERGLWSPVRTFRVAGLGSHDGEADREPPSLDLVAITRYGSIFIVEGRTEPGTIVEVNGEPVSVHASGAFTKTIQIVGDGWDFIVVRAHDAWGNTSERRQRVYLEANA
jgi:hypothetical protein